MAEEPQPPIHEGASTPPAPGTAEDRKTAAALSSLDARDDDASSSAKKEIDTQALDKAMKNLTVAGDKADSGAKSASDAPKKSVKIEAADISLLVEQLDLSKPKATELLRANDGDAVKAMTAFVGAALA